MRKEISYKIFFKNYGIFVSILAVVFGVTIYIVKLSQKSWQKNLKISVENVLNETEPDTWTVGNFNQILNPLSQHAACYDVRNKKNGENYKAVIIRIQTFYGPLPAVFIIDNNNVVTLKGFSSLHGRVYNQIININANKRINYWKEKLPEIIQQEGKNEK